MMAVAVSLVKAAGESGHTCFFIYTHRSFCSESDYKSVSTKSDCGNRTTSQTDLSSLAIKNPSSDMPKFPCFLLVVWPAWHVL